MLWLFPPGVVHGWVGEAGRSCEIVVLHYSKVPLAVEQLARKYGHLETKLTPRDKADLRRIARTLKLHYWHPTLESEIHVERVLMDLCLLILRDYKERYQPESTGRSHSRVVAAEDWLGRNLAANASVKGAAQQVGLSVSQLYRLFERVRRESPREILNRLKLERAMELLGTTNAKLQQVAAECGFSNATNLCRVFKSAKGMSPSTWRREIFIEYKVPSSRKANDHTQHGRRRRDAL